MTKRSRKRPASEVEETSLEKPAAAGGGASLSERESPSTNNNEIRFGRHLASSDKRVRDRTVSALREWLFHRSKGGALTDLDLLKIWRGLWYCMFMCDKAPVQTELAQNLTSLMDLFKEKMEGVRFFRSFCITMQRDWERIDNLRIDKYYTLVRLFVRQAVSFCRVRHQRDSSAAPQVQAGDSQKKHAKKKKKSQPPATGTASPGRLADRDTAANCDDEEAQDEWEWDLDLLRAVVAVVEEEILTVRMAPIGLRLHVADVWIEEACTAGGEEMSTEAVLVLLAPWLRVAAAPSTDSVVFKRTYERVFQELLACFPQGGDENDEGKRVFKKVDLVRVQACLFEVAAAPQTREKRRALLYQLHRKYQKVTAAAPDANAPPSGILPSPLEETYSEEDGSEFVEAGARPRAVRGPEPPVAGWAAAGIAAGDITASGEEGIGTARMKKGGKLGKKSGEEKQAEPFSGNDNGGKGSSGGVVERKGVKEEGENGVHESKRAKKRSRSEDEPAEGDQQEAFVDGTKEEGSREESAGSGRKKKKNKMKKKSQKKQTEAEAPSVVEQEESDEGGREIATSTAVAGAHSPELGTDDIPVLSEKTKSKKGKIVAKSPRAGTPEKSLDGGKRDGDGEAVHPAVRSQHDRGSNDTFPVPAKSPSPSSAPASASPSSERKKKKKRRRDSQGDHEDGGDDDVTTAAVAEPTESVAVEGGTSASQVTARKKIKAERKGQAMEEDGIEAALPVAPLSSASDEGEASTGTPTQQQQSGNKKNKKKSTSPGTEPILSPTSADASLKSPPVPPFFTPPKTSNGSTPNNTPGKSGSAKKTVTFGTNTVKEHTVSVKDLKSRVITPSKDSGTPKKKLLKVAGDSETKSRRSSVGRKGTPAQRSRRATDFF